MIDMLLRGIGVVGVAAITVMVATTLVIGVITLITNNASAARLFYGVGALLLLAGLVSAAIYRHRQDKRAKRETERTWSRDVW